ncbi:DUF167 domain-containing protein [Caldimonas sp. KR1-144]|uniref:DUF167 domain-containing protein n=1 Tax=Caldimonas sp. KR1-144 TaxID=3400911 RepID=UPI003C0AEABA
MASATNVPYLRATARGGSRLDVSVAPNARSTAIAGVHGDTLRVRLAAQPIEGAANEALLRWLAQSLGIARSQLRLAHGASSRRKSVEIDLEVERVRAWIAQTLADGQ